METNNYTNLEMLYEQGKILGFSDFQQLTEAVNFLIEWEYLECNNYNRYSVMVTEKGKIFVDNNFIHQTVEITRTELQYIVAGILGIFSKRA
jgi:hypothetical protein